MWILVISPVLDSLHATRCATSVFFGLGTNYPHLSFFCLLPGGTIQGGDATDAALHGYRTHRLTRTTTPHPSAPPTENGPPEQRRACPTCMPHPRQPWLSGEPQGGSGGLDNATAGLTLRHAVAHRAGHRPPAGRAAGAVGGRGRQGRGLRGGGPHADALAARAPARGCEVHV